MSASQDKIPYSTIHINALPVRQIIAGETDAPAILMLHGWGASAELVWPLGKRLTTMGYRVLIPDMPGFGDSVEPPTAWAVHDYAQWVMTYADTHQLDHFYLFGHSFGGRLGLILGAEQAERIQAMVLADSAGIQPQLPLAIRMRLTTYKGVRDGLKKIGLGKLSDTLRTWYNQRYGSTDFQDVSGVMRETFVKVVNEDLQEYAKRVAVPTLLIWGDADKDTPLSQGKRLEQLIPDAGLVVFPGAGHYSYLEQPDQASRAMTALFKSTTSTPPVT